MLLVLHDTAYGNPGNYCRLGFDLSCDRVEQLNQSSSHVEDVSDQDL